MGKRNVLCFGSINIDHVYTLNHIVQPGETLSSSSYAVSAGGKGANQSVALAKTELVQVYHAGMIGKDGIWIKEELGKLNVDTNFIRIDEKKHTGTAIIQLDETKGENAIILYPGTNFDIDVDDIQQVIQHPTFQAGDVLLLQNEVSGISHMMKIAKEKGLMICFNCAPFHKDIPSTLPLELVDILIMNETEAIGMFNASKVSEENADIQEIENGKEQEFLEKLATCYSSQILILTLGSRGACLLHRRKPPNEGEEFLYQEPPSDIQVVDTTGAGDTFTGYFVGFILMMDNGISLKQCLKYAVYAASFACEKKGTFYSIPHLKDIQDKITRKSM